MSVGVCHRCLKSKTGIAHGLCWVCRKPERDRVRDRERAALRRPPRGRYASIPGVCNLCGDPVGPGRRFYCSQEHADLFTLASSPQMARFHLVSLHGDVCVGCGDETLCELDHRRPLWSLTADERQDIRWWLPSNLQLLGERCHKEKTRREARSRAAYRRALAEGRQVRYVG